MATLFPTTLDSYTTKSAGDTVSESHMNDVQDAIEALEEKVGVDASAVTSSHDYKITYFTIENRTSDPTSPGVGRIWFRTDI